jgi:hypothetical protein
VWIQYVRSHSIRVEMVEYMNVIHCKVENSKVAIEIEWGVYGLLWGGILLLWSVQLKLCIYLHNIYCNILGASAERIPSSDVITCGQLIIFITASQMPLSV